MTTDYQRVRELFQKAVGLAASQQAVYLDTECAGDPDHRKAVQELLDHHSDEPLLMSRQDKTSGGQTIRQGQTQTSLGNRSRGLVQRANRNFPNKRRLVWLLAPAAAILLTLLAFRIHDSIKESVRNTQRYTMQAMLDQQVLSLRHWLRTEADLVGSWTRSPKLQNTIATLREEANNADDPKAALATSPTRLELRKLIQQLSGNGNEVHYAVWSRDGMQIADSDELTPCLGNGLTRLGGSILSRSMAGESVLWLPTTKGYITQGFNPPTDQWQPGVTFIVPVYASQNESQPIACITVAGRGLQDSFEEIMASAQFGTTGEAYALDQRGYLITESRFLDGLREANMIADRPDLFSAQRVRVADPGGNIKSGFRPSIERRDEWPLTRAAAAAIAGRNGDNFDGYVDYRGVKVVGVWRWVDEYDFGVIAEMDHEAAFAPLDPLRRAYNVLLGLLGLSLLGFTAVAIAITRARKKVDIAKQIGPYQIEKKIGEGGIGRVYLATHELLKRPTALKLLKREANSPDNLRRFERETRMASSLTHPNTIEIYDYGKTPDGGFYSAMEFVDGLTLAQIIELDGPQCPQRVKWILYEICKSLREAHARGMVHRDIKPQNIMLCCRGGEADAVKVLDFGLAREVSQSQSRITQTLILAGTPMYIAPERIGDPDCMDPRSDIFALGVVAHVLLTGREPFDASGALEAIAKTVNEDPSFASRNSPWDVPDSLDSLIHQCQAKKPDDRPASVSEILCRLDEIEFASSWTSQNAVAWWRENAPEIADRSQLPQHGKESELSV